jgi:hypothetical protein
MPLCGRCHVKTRQAGCAQPITIPGETGLVRIGFRKLRHKLTLILPIGWRLILSDLIEKFLESFSRRSRPKQQSIAAVEEEMYDAI